ncbi:MAG: AarF/ABC1/UbiB kinase family protein [Bacillota bacterium]
MELGLRKRYKHFQRYREIANVLIRHGFGYLLHELELTQFVGRKKRELAARPEAKNLPRAKKARRLRMALEDLGPTFVKLGQLLSARADLLAAEYIRELEKLQDKVPPFAFEKVAETVQMELGHYLEEIFDGFERAPLAAASIGQVHRAVLKTKERVAVKVRRPEIEKVLATDLEILYDLARLADRHAPFREMYSFREMAEEFEQIVTEELDFTREGRHADTFRKNFRDDPNIYIPAVYWEYTTPRVLTMEYVEGVKLTDPAEIVRQGVNGRKIARLLTGALLRQILIDGFFHADPHPGNLFALPGDRLMFMDFGIVGRLDENLKEKIGDLVLGLVNRSTPQVARAIAGMGVLPPDIDRHAFYRDVERMRDKYYDVPFKELRLADSVNDVIHIAYKHRIRIPTQITMLAKALVTAEGVSRQLDPELSIAEIARPLSRRLLARRFSLQGIRRLVFENLADYHHLFTHLPRRLEQVLELAASGQLKVTARNPETDRVMSRINILVNRLVLSILLGSLMIGSALLAGREYMVFRGVSLAELLFVAGGILVLALVFSILRFRKF